ncbi:hypothetical protein [Leifsonia sp. Leaf264]|uniref:hypothetical protein n=1 Tax=Leifsonia sp. Leaf264 TaxID=1736314 RepID=UPI0006F35AE5|nr:hypothetical protein [Leifsonia sp. Leaf264]KQP01429.1 hypothetical protein ASF30_02085 [Leifsonia sp. Leaf264]
MSLPTLTNEVIRSEIARIEARSITPSRKPTADVAGRYGTGWQRQEAAPLMRAIIARFGGITVRRHLDRADAATMAIEAWLAVGMNIPASADAVKWTAGAIKALARGEQQFSMFLTSGETNNAEYVPQTKTVKPPKPVPGAPFDGVVHNTEGASFAEPSCVPTRFGVTPNPVIGAIPGSTAITINRLSLLVAEAAVVSAGMDDMTAGALLHELVRRVAPTQAQLVGELEQRTGRPSGASTRRSAVVTLQNARQDIAGRARVSEDAVTIVTQMLFGSRTAGGLLERELDVDSEFQEMLAEMSGEVGSDYLLDRRTQFVTEELTDYAQPFVTRLRELA